jgi:hypothetical protein
LDHPERGIEGRPLLLTRIISGGQTGVDRGALEAALAWGLEHGGFCPKGRRSEDGRVPDIFQLEETESPHYPARTAMNVQLADATLLLVRGKDGFAKSRGTKLTRELCEKKQKPWWAADPRNSAHVERVVAWLVKFDVHVLNVAGPRESTNPKIQEETRTFMRMVFEQLS